jgi:hypothetical protein
MLDMCPFELPDIKKYNAFLAPSPDRCLHPFYLRKQYSDNVDLYITGKCMSYLQRWKPYLWSAPECVVVTQWWENSNGTCRSVSN